jgi:hypothetical protein
MRFRWLVLLLLVPLAVGALLVLGRGTETGLPSIIDLNITAADRDAVVHCCGLGNGRVGKGAMPVSRLRNIRERPQVASSINVSILGDCGRKALDNVTSIALYTGKEKAQPNTIVAVRSRRWWPAVGMLQWCTMRGLQRSIRTEGR